MESQSEVMLVCMSVRNGFTRLKYTGLCIVYVPFCGLKHSGGHDSCLSVV